MPCTRVNVCNKTFIIYAEFPFYLVVFLTFFDGKCCFPSFFILKFNNYLRKGGM